jgi:hypothetical protein
LKSLWLFVPWYLIKVEEKGGELEFGEVFEEEFGET